MSTPDAVTMADNAIHNPDEPRHFMAIKPIAARVRLFHAGAVVAETTKAVRVVEVGRSVYDPVIYVPAADVTVPLTRLDKTSHCPLKGDATYYAWDGEELAWSYEAPFDFARDLARRRAFWASKVAIEETPAG